MDRRQFLLAAAAAPFVLRAPPSPLAFVTEDTEARVAVVDLATGRIVQRIATRQDPFSIERVGDVAVVAHTVVGAVSILDARTRSVRHVLDGFVEPRYTAAAPDGRHAFVTDSGRVEVLTVDVLRGEIVGRLKLTLWPRHISLAPDGRTLWVSLGTAAPAIAVVDVSEPTRTRLRGHVRPGFLAHDVGFSPAGRAWVTSGAAHTIAVYANGTPHRLSADAPPQHVTFLDGRAFVTSGGSGTLRVYDERTARLLRTTAIPAGSYNVQFAAGRVLTPSLSEGTLCVVDTTGRVQRTVHVAPSSHDACLA